MTPLTDRALAVVGGRIDGGAILDVGWVGGEQMARIVRAPFKGAPEFATVPVDPTKVAPKSPNLPTIINLATFIANRRTNAIDSTESEAHDAIRTLIGDVPLMLNPIPVGLVPEGDTPVGWVDRSSLIEPGMVIWQAKGIERNQATREDLHVPGGLVLSVSEHPSGRVFAVIDEQAFTSNIVTHLRATEVHWCDEKNCPACPRFDGALARRLFRRVHRHFAAQKGRPTPVNLRLINIATTLRRCVA